MALSNATQVKFTLSNGTEYEVLEFAPISPAVLPSFSIHKPGASQPALRWDKPSNVKNALGKLDPFVGGSVSQVIVHDDAGAEAFRISVVAGGEYRWQKQGTSFYADTPLTAADIATIKAAIDNAANN